MLSSSVIFSESQHFLIFGYFLVSDSAIIINFFLYRFVSCQVLLIVPSHRGIRKRSGSKEANLSLSRKLIVFVLKGSPLCYYIGTIQVSAYSFYRHTIACNALCLLCLRLHSIDRGQHRNKYPRLSLRFIFGSN